MALPDPITDLCAWHGDDMAKSDRWVRWLEPEHIEDIDKALWTVEQRDLEWQEITQVDFPLPRLGALITDIQDELENGSGLMKLKGFPVGQYTEDQLRKLYYGFGQHIGTTVHQNRRGELMRFIRDEGGNTGEKYGQIDSTDTPDGKTFLSSYARTLNNGPLRFHTDRTDVVSLLCVRQAAQGGMSTICSSVNVMNEMCRRRPDLAELLFHPIPRSRLGEETDRADVTYDLPVFGIRDGKFTSHFSMTYVEAAQTVASVPRLSDAQREALDLLLSLAGELSFEMSFEPGDIQFLNSHVTYHGRSGFEDNQGMGQDRLLMRLWFSMPNSRPLPADHKILWRNVEAGAPRGGIGLEEQSGTLT